MAHSRREFVCWLGGAISLSVLPPLARASGRLRIGVIGAGALGSTLGRLWLKAGHEVMFSTLHAEDLRPMADGLGPLATAGAPLEAVAFGSVVLLAVPHDALPGLSGRLASALRGKVVLDASNLPPYRASADRLDTLSAGVAMTSANLLPGARLVRVFDAVAPMVIERSFVGQSGRIGVPLAGDDPDAVSTAAQLVRDAGCEPVVAGGLASARRFQQDGPGFRANAPDSELRQKLGLST